MHFSPPHCPNSRCPTHFNSQRFSYIKKGHFVVKRLNQRFRKYQCKICKIYFSYRTFQIDRWHKKMDLNPHLAKLLVEGNSLRGASRILGLTYFNTYKKFLWLRNLTTEAKTNLSFEAHEIQFDELETIHHTKCKPLSIALAVNEKHQLLAIRVGEIPAKGKLAHLSRRKYGPRGNDRPLILENIFSDLSNYLQTKPLKIKSDANPTYKNYVTRFFPHAHYEQHCRRRNIHKIRERLHEAMAKKKFDHLFAINHMCALLRDRINRLTRRSWCTTKKVENLQLHLDLFLVLQKF